MEKNQPSISEIDRRYLDAALRFARRNQGQTGTNPSVACVLVREIDDEFQIVGSGITAPGGRPHAEPIALAEAGERANGATAYVTLEPCAHHGRTPPCAQTLIDAGVMRVVAATKDPDNRVDGKGFQMLKSAGIETIFENIGENSARVVQAYLKSKTSNKPFVTLKLAMTAEGVMGLRGGGQLELTGSIANAQTHLLRARHDAILVGINTILFDNPALTCRLPGLESRSPIRVILDANAQLRDSHTVIKTAKQVATIVATPNQMPEEYQRMLQQSGGIQLACELDNGHIALPELMDDLRARGIQSLLVEGGAQVAASFLKEDLVDEIMLLEAGLPPALDETIEIVLAPFTASKLPQGFEIREELRFGDDRCLRLGKLES